MQDKIEIAGDGKNWLPISIPCTGSAGLDPAHPDAAGGRVEVLFGPDGVLMVDTEDPQLAAKTLDTIRTFSNGPIKIVKVNSQQIHPDHTGGNAFFAKQGAVIYAQENLRDESNHHINTTWRATAGRRYWRHVEDTSGAARLLAATHREATTERDAGASLLPTAPDQRI